MILLLTALACVAPTSKMVSPSSAPSSDSSYPSEVPTEVMTLVSVAGSDDVTWDPAGRLLASDLVGEGRWPINPQGSEILAIDPDSGEVTPYGSGVPLPLGSSLAPDGTLYVAAYGRSAGVWAIPPGGGVAWEVVGGLGYPSSVVIADDGALWVTAWSEDRVVRVLDGEIQTLAALPGPVGMDRRPDGEVIVGASDGWVYTVAADGTATRWAESPGSDFAIAGGHTFATSLDGHVVMRIDNDGAAEVYSGTGAAGNNDGPLDEASFTNPNGIAASPDGLRLFVQQLDRRLRVIPVVVQ